MTIRAKLTKHKTQQMAQAVESLIYSRRQQSEKEMLVMMEESEIGLSEMVSALQLDAGTIIMWVCLIGCCCSGCNTIYLCGYNGADDAADHKQQAILCIHHHEMVKQLDDKVNRLDR